MKLKALILFILGVQILSWGTVFLVRRTLPDVQQAASIAMSLVAFGPMVMAILLRFIFKETWSDSGLKFRLKTEKGWYVFGLIYPLFVIGMIITISLVLGTGSLVPDRGDSIASILTLMSVLIVPMMVASIGEEFGWRGYLEPGLQKQLKSPALTHLIVGVVWGTWHFPLLLSADPEIGVKDLLMVLTGCIGLAFIYGQIRIRSGSVWPCVLLHAFSNIFTISFAASELLVVQSQYKNLVSLNSTSLAFTGIWILTGLVFLFTVTSSQKRGR